MKLPPQTAAWLAEGVEPTPIAAEPRRARLPPVQKPRRRQPGAGRNAVKETIRLTTGTDPKRWGGLELAFSEDVVKTLVTWRDGGKVPDLADPFLRETLRVEFLSFESASMPGILVRAEPLSLAPQGNRLRRAARGRAWITQVQSRRLGIHPGIKTQKLDWFEAENMRGVVLVFHPEDFLATMTNPPATPEEREALYR